MEARDVRNGPRGSGRRSAIVALVVLLAAVAFGGWLLAARGAASADAADRSGGRSERERAEPERPGAEGAPERQAGAVVGMTDGLAFEPTMLEVRVGETVHWENTSDLPHTVTGDPGKAGDPRLARLPEGAEPFDSGLLRPGETFSHTFTVPGEYRYFCIPHRMARMAGTVIVEP